MWGRRRRLLLWLIHWPSPGKKRCQPLANVSTALQSEATNSRADLHPSQTCSHVAVKLFSPPSPQQPYLKVLGNYTFTVDVKKKRDPFHSTFKERGNVSLNAPYRENLHNIRSGAFRLGATTQSFRIRKKVQFVPTRERKKNRQRCRAASKPPEMQLEAVRTGKGGFAFGFECLLHSPQENIDADRWKS